MGQTENEAAVRQAADALLDAYDTHVPLDPLVERWPGLSLDDAYAVQLLQVDHRRSLGRRVRGHKVGLTSNAMQQMLGVEQPDYGHLFDDMFHPEGAAVPASLFLQPRVEPELCFVLGRRLAGPGVTISDAQRAVDAVLPGLEIIDSRIRDWRITLVDTIADNASSGGAVLGARASDPRSHDLAHAGCNLTRNGELAETGAGGAVLGQPLVALAWLANTLGERGVALEPGDVVLSGACTRAIALDPGDVVVADFGELGTVTVSLSDADGSSG
jgi:2-keto-4-pentenoate hydratase